MPPEVLAVNSSSEHSFSKANRPQIRLIADFGVEGDAHAGKRVTHLHHIKKDPTKPNLRQVHLISEELLDELNRSGFKVRPGELGENITTRNIDLHSLPTGTRLKIGFEAVIELTALRNPCIQIDNFRKGLQKELIYKDAEGNLVRRGGVMGIVLVGGGVCPGDPISITLPDQPYQPLEYVW